MTTAFYLLLLPLSSIWIWFSIHQQLQLDLPPAVEGQDLVLIGQIVDLPKTAADNSLRFTFDIATAMSAGHSLPLSGLVLLTWYRNAPQIHAGEFWQLPVRLKARHGMINPGSGLDYEGWLFRQGIIATGSVREEKKARIGATGGGVSSLVTANLSTQWQLYLNRPQALGTWGVLALREYLQKQLWQPLPRTIGVGIAQALVLGDTRAITPEAWTVLNQAGISQLIAISGSHISLIGWLGFGLGSLLWRSSSTLCRMLPAPNVAALSGFTVAWVYGLIAGFPVATLRSVWMLAFVYGTIVLHRLGRKVWMFILTLLSVIIIDPLAVLTPGFWLSFAAVAILLYGFTGRIGLPSWWMVMLRAQYLIFIGLFPLLAWWFSQIPVIAPLVNIVAVPLFVVLLPALLLASAIALISNWFLPLLALTWVLDWFMQVLYYVTAALPFTITIAERPWWLWFMSIIGVILILAPRGLPGRWAGLPLLVLLWVWPSQIIPPGSLRMTLLDVGQGLAVLLQTHSHCLVYDTGPKFLSGFNTGEAVLIPTLRHYGIDHIDLLMVSHADIDHAGGVNGLLTRIPVLNITSGEPADLALTIKPQTTFTPNITQCQARQSWTWDGVTFTVLHPLIDVENTHTPPKKIKPIKSNDRSCVLHVATQGGGAVLLTGDLGTVREYGLVKLFGNKLQSSVLVAGHHGSASSTSLELLQQVRPSWVLVSAGYRNRFGFPHRQVLENIAKIGAKVASTINSGALEVWFDATGAMQEPYAYRQLHAYPWTHQPLLQQ